jgi:hypothetical protein
MLKNLLKTGTHGKSGQSTKLPDAPGEATLTEDNCRAGQYFLAKLYRPSQELPFAGACPPQELARRRAGC